MWLLGHQNPSPRNNLSIGRFCSVKLYDSIQVYSTQYTSEHMMLKLNIFIIYYENY